MKTIQHIWRGGSNTLIGRFGQPTPGTSLPLNEKEARDVKDDARFERSDKPFERLVFKPTAPKPNESEQQKQARIKADQEREALWELLNQEFDRNEDAKG